MKQVLDNSDVARIIKRLDKIEESLSIIKTLLKRVVEDTSHCNISKESVAIILGEKLMRQNETRRKKRIKASGYKLVKGSDELKQIEINVKRELL